MAYALGLPDALRRRGLTVETVPGWETRSAGSFAPHGAICHWTAGPANSKTRPSLNVVVNGRPDLDGPLCNVYLDRNGIAVVVAAGRANHGGAGNWRGATGNSAFFGTECEAAGPDDFTPAQRWAYPRVNAAYCDLGKFGADMVCGHSEYALPKGRKTDVNDYPMTAMRTQISALLAGQDDDMPNYMQWSQQDKEALVYDVWNGTGLTLLSGVVGDGGKKTKPIDQLLYAAAQISALVPAVVNGILDAPIDRTDQKRSATTLRAVTAWSDAHVDDLNKAITNALTGTGPVDANAIAEQVRTAIAAKLAGLKFAVTAS